MADEKHDSQKPRPVKKNVKTIAIVVIVVIIVLALALGLGLGLGLKKRHASKASSVPATSGPGNTDDSYASTNVEPWRRSTIDYSLDFSDWDLNAEPTVRVYNLTVSEANIAPDGVNRIVLMINSQFPGPIIRLNRGDRLIVNVTNSMSNATTMHWHGLYQNGTNWFDGPSGITQCPIPPGQSLIYNFTIENQYGTYWYHAHKDTQLVDGISGPLIIHAPEEAETRKQYDFDQVIMVQDWYHDLTSALMDQYLASGNENAEPVPDNGLLQGTNYFNCSSYDEDSGYTCANDSSRSVFEFEQNKRYRLRFIASSAFTAFQISVDNHTLEIIEADGIVTEPLPVHRFEIATAQRYSAILTTNQSASTNYWLRAQMNTNCYAADSNVLDPLVLGLVTYKNDTAAPTSSVDWSDAVDNDCNELNYTLLHPATKQQPPPADVVFEIQFFFQIGAQALSRANVNGTQWIPSLQNPTLNQAITGLKSSNNSVFSTSGVSTAFSANQYVITVPSSAAVVDLIVMNFDDGSHPFHLHGHHFWVMYNADYLYFPWNTDLYSQINATTTNSINENPIKRDTITIAPYGFALIRFLNNVPGMWAFHCHNAWHMQAGLLMQFMARPEDIQGWTLPNELSQFCTASAS